MKKIIVLSILIASFITSCKKDFEVKQTLVNEITTEKFFKLPPHIKPEAKKVFDYLKAENDKKEFVKNFVSKYGFIDWRFATVSKPKLQVESATENFTFVEMPLASDDLTFAKGFLISKVYENGVVYSRIVSDKKYMSLPYGDLEDGVLNAEDLQMKVMIMNKELYGISKFKIEDNLLFDKLLPLDKQLMANSTGGELEINNVTTTSVTTEGARQVTVTVVVKVEIRTQNCTTPIYCASIGGCDWLKPCNLCSSVQTFKFPVEIEVTIEDAADDWGDWGGGGSSSGGGSDPTGGGSCPGCPPPTPDPCQDPNLPARTSEFKPCDANNTGLVILTDDQIISQAISPSQIEIDFLNINPETKHRLAFYLNNSKSPNKNSIGQKHLQKLISDQDYFNFVKNYENNNPGDKMWWEDDVWLDNPSNFNLDPNDVYDKLTVKEKELVKEYPQEAFQINRNTTKANDMTIARMGNSGLNDKSDAFRHAFFSAINERDCGKNVATGESIAELFGIAHESETPQQLALEQHMDLRNNNEGYTIVRGYSWPIFNSNNTIADDVMTKLTTGILRYLSPTLNSSQDPNYWGTGGVPDPKTATHGITVNTQLKPTNQ